MFRFFLWNICISCRQFGTLCIILTNFGAFFLMIWTIQRSVEWFFNYFCIKLRGQHVMADIPVQCYASSFTFILGCQILTSWADSISLHASLHSSLNARLIIKTSLGPTPAILQASITSHVKEKLTYTLDILKGPRSKRSKLTRYNKII